MILKFEIIVDEGGVKCTGSYNGMDAYSYPEANLMAVGALEIARSSLLAQRWGLRHNTSLVVDPVSKLFPDPKTAQNNDE